MYMIHITGPGIDWRMEIATDADMEIVRLLLAKATKAIQEPASDEEE